MLRAKLRTLLAVPVMVAGAVFLVTVAAAADADELPVGVELELRKTHLLPYEPLIGRVTLTNEGAKPVRISGYWSFAAMQFEGDGNEGRLDVTWGPNIGLLALPVDLAAGGRESCVFRLPTFARDNALLLRPGTEYDVWKQLDLGEAKRRDTERLTVTINPPPEEERAAVKALTSRKIGDGQPLVRAMIVYAVPRDPATMRVIRDFVLEFPDSVYSVHLRRAYLELAGMQGPELTAPERAAVIEYDAYFATHPDDLLAPPSPLVEHAVRLSKPPPAKPAPPPLKPAGREDVKAVRRLVADYYAAYLCGDADAYLGTMTDDFRFGGEQGRGREQMRPQMEEEAAENREAGNRYRITSEVKVDGVDDDGEVVAKVTIASFKDADPVNPPSHWVWRLRRVDGRWKVRLILRDEDPPKAGEDPV